MAAAINNNFGTLLVNTYAAFPSLNPTGEDRSYMYIEQATCAIPVVGTDLAGSTYRMCRINSSDIPLSVKYAGTALTGGALSVGIYLANTGAVAATNSDHLFATSINTASAVAYTEERFVNLSITTTGQRVWQLLGLASDPHVDYDLVYTSTTGATAAGTLGCQYVYTR